MDNYQSETNKEIQKRIDQSRQTIDFYVKQSRQNRRYYECIASHYASFTLADTIYEQCNKIGSTYEKLKTRNKQLGNQIDDIGYKINHKSAKHQDRNDLMQQHKALCNERHRVSVLQHIYGEGLAQYTERLDYQNNVTRRCRDYIGRNFGRKGRSWLRRLDRRKRMKHQFML